MNMNRRKTSVICESEELEPLYTIKNFPVYMGVTDLPQEGDLFADMEWMIGKETGMIQLKSLVPEEILYANSHNSSIGTVWEGHHRLFADFIGRYDPNSVLEIGGGNGRLSLYFGERYKCGSWTICEPSSIEPLEGVKASYIRGFFETSGDYISNLTNDMIVHSHTLEHIYDPVAFIGKCSKVLENGKYMCFSIPNLKQQVIKKFSNALNFEHTYYLTEDYVPWMLESNGLEIVEKKYFMDDHSIFFACKKNSLLKDKNIVAPNMYDLNKKTYLEYVDYYRELVHDLNSIIKKREHRTYLFGAHIFSQNLICFGLDTERISAILDNDIRKQGKRMYGTKIFVENPAVLALEEKPLVILKCGSYNEEIRKGILEGINAETEFIE